MLPIFVHGLRRLRGQILGWGGILLLIGLMTIPAYDVIAKNPDPIKQMLQQVPPEMLAFFAQSSKLQDLGKVNFADPAVFLDMNIFSFLPLILGFFAILLGSGLLVSDEENGTLDLVLAHPISRTSLFVGRLAAALVATLLVLALIWLGMVVPMIWSSLAVSSGALVLPFVSLLGVLLLFAMLALLLSMLLPSRRVAAMTAGTLLVFSYFVTSLAKLNSSLKPVARLMPLRYYQSADAIEGLNYAWLSGLLGVALLFTVLAWWRFERRDIRVAGEGSWRWFSWRKAAP
jgi:ABC-2 type transport system permease protein